MSGRLHSLDVFRGFDMFWIMGGDALVIALAALFGCGSHEGLAQQMHHPDWVGFRFIDLVFPTFIFIAGVSWPFSYARQLEKGFGRGKIILRVLKRYAILFLLGLVYMGVLLDGPAGSRWDSVLGRIGFAWAGAALLYVFFSFRARLGIAAALLLGYWGVSLAFGAPDHPEAGRFTMEGCLAGWIDRMWCPGQIPNDGLVANQGLLSNLPAVVTAMLGVFTGEYLRESAHSGSRKALTMVGAAVGLLAAGLFVAFGCGSWSFPIIKKLWSPSYVLLCGAYSLGLFAVFYWLVDVKGVWRHTLFFKVIGMNSIAIYFGQSLVGFWRTNERLFTWVSTLFPGNGPAVVMALGYIAVCWCFLYFLYRKNVFLRV